MTVALLLAAAPDRLSAMTRPTRRPGDRIAGSRPRTDGVDSRLAAIGVRHIEVVMCADAADGLRAVAATARACEDSVLIAAAGRPLATSTSALAALLRHQGTAALPGSGALLIAKEDLPVAAVAADALATRIASGERLGAGRQPRFSLRRMHRMTRVSGELNTAVLSLIQDIDDCGVRVSTPALPARSPALAPGQAAGNQGAGARQREPGLLAALAVAPVASRIARWAAARSLSPNALTCTAFALAACAAIWFAAGTRAGAIAGALLLCAALYVRHARARLAAHEPAAAAFGSWLEAISGMAAEYGVYAGLAIGWTTARPHQAWELATAAMVLLAVRRMADASYASVAERRHPGGQAGAGYRLLRLAGQSIAFPAAERTAVIAVTAPLWGPRVALPALLGWGVVAFGYSLAERAVASRVPAPVRDGGDGGGRPARSGAR